MNFSTVVLMVASDGPNSTRGARVAEIGAGGMYREKIADPAGRNVSIFVKGQSKTNLRLPLSNVVSIIRIIMP